MMYLEIKRLYFDYRLNEKGQQSIKLDIIREDECSHNDFNILDTSLRFLGQIDGCQHKYIRIDLRKVKKKAKTFDEMRKIATYKERTGFPPPIIYDTIECKFHLNILQVVRIEYDIERFEYLRKNKDDKFDAIPLLEVAKVIQDESIIQKDPGPKGKSYIIKKSEVDGYNKIKAI